MDNQYNYYRPDEDRAPENNYYQEAPKPPKKNKKAPKKILAVAGLAVMFGVIGGLTFQGTSYVTGRLLGTNNKKTENSTSVSNTQLTTAKSTISSDVSDVVDSTIPSIVSITNMSVQQVQSFFGGTSQQESKSVGSGIIIS